MNRLPIRRQLALDLVLIVAALALPLLVPTGLLSVAVFVVIAAIGAQGVNIVIGFAGQLSFGHAFFLAVGAYTAGVLGADYGLDALIWLPAAGLLAALMGVIVAPTAVRLRGLYLSIVTIALVVVGQYLYVNLDQWTGGAAGRTIPALRFGGLDFSVGKELVLGPVVIGRDRAYYYVGLVILVLTCLFVFNLSRSRIGRAMLAIKEGELGAAVLGVNATRIKIAAFALSAFFAGISGALFGSYLSYVQPDQWSLVLSVEYVAAIIIGGTASVWGPLIGAAVVFALPSAIERLPLVSTDGGIAPANLAAIFYAVVITLVLLNEPRGIVGLVERLRRRWFIPSTPRIQPRPGGSL